MFGNNHDQQNDGQAQDHTAPAADVSTVPDPTPSATLDESAPADIQLPTSVTMPGNITAPAATTDNSAAPADATTAPATPVADSPVAPDNLLQIKQEALHQLAPLVDHLEQTPEERFRTTMMMIQATDDSSKLKDAYDAAQSITDEKVRAQALLDVVNEINYFTQQHHEDHSA